MNLRVTTTTTGAVFTKESLDIIQKNLDRAITSATLLLHREVIARTPQGVFGAQGGLLGSIKHQVTGKGTIFVKGIVGSAQKYAEIVEKGRRPGKGMPPAGTLLRWIEVKMGVDAKTAQRIEFVVRRKIGQKGFEGAQMFEKAFDENRTKIEAIFEKAGFTITRELSQ